MPPDSTKSINLDDPIGDLYEPLCKVYRKKPVLYLYPPTAFDSASKETNSSERFLYQGNLPGFSYASVLGIFSQPLAFCSGPSEVLIFEDVADDAEPVTRLVTSIVDTIAPKQRPKLHILKLSGTKAAHDAVKAILGPDGILINNRPDDWAQGLPNLVDLDTQYKLESKLVLHESPIPSPDAEILWLSVAKTAEGEESWNDLEKALATKPAPFVVKLTHSGGGQGVFIAKDEPRRQEMLKGLKSLRTLDKAVSDGQFSTANGSSEDAERIPVLVTDYIDAPTQSIVFNVTHDADEPHILGIMDQVLLPNGISWEGVRIDYTQQDKLRQQFMPLMKITTKWLHGEGFRGLACVDFLVDRDGKPKVVDLNPRFGGAAPLCFVRSYFQERGCSVVYLSKYKYPGPEGDAERLLETLEKDIVMATISKTELSPQNTFLQLFVGGRDVEHATACRERVLDEMSKASA